MQHRSIRGSLAGLVGIVTVLLVAAVVAGIVAVARLGTTVSGSTPAGAAEFLDVVLSAIAGLLVVLFVLLSLLFRWLVTVPVRRLADQVRSVGDMTTDAGVTVTATGPRQLVALAAEIDAMRRRALTETGQLRQARDTITERGRELDRANAELARSNADLEQFAYVASHDLQEPLRKVTSFCQLLQRRYQAILDERGNQYIEFAVDAARRMQVLINELLRFARVGQGAEFTDVDTGELARQAIANLGITDTGARIVCTGLPTVRGEAPLLTMVFQNLIGNAVKFRGDESPQVAVTAVREDDTWTFTVADNGIGIDGEHAERIFVIFQRLHAGDDYPGTGIGLAMCRRIVEFHGGRIWLDTEHSGPGATFRFTLPAAPEPVAARV